MSYKRVKKPKAKPNKPLVAGRALIVLTLIYFVIELIINASVYGQLSGSSDMLMSEVMEFWGKIIAGLGIGLLITRYQLAKRTKQNYINTNGYIYKTFLLICLATIPLSFVLQESLIHYVTSQASDEDRNKAILVSAAHNTMVPFYVPSKHNDWHNLNPLDKLVYPASRFMTRRSYWYWESKGADMESSLPCSIASTASIGATNDTDKVFFAYKTMLTSIDEDFYKQVIKDHYLCAFEDERYFTNRTSGTLNKKDLLREAYRTRYNPAVEKYTKYTAGKFGRKTAKKIADDEWRKRMDEVYGFKTTIKPVPLYHEMKGIKPGESYFYDHPDTRRYYAEQTGIKDLYPIDEDFPVLARKKLKENLPDQIIPAYISTTGERSEASKELTDEQIVEQGKKAYKAIVMPMIALGLSCFFLILNMILAINGVVDKFVIKKLAGDASKSEKQYIERLDTLNIFNKPIFSDARVYKEYEFMRDNHFNKTLQRTVLKFMYNPIVYPLKCLSLKAFLIVALAWFIFWPSLQTGQEYEAFEGTSFEQSAKWLYYHESNLIPVYNASYDALSYVASGGEEDGDLWTVLIGVITK
ncbi:hypothetical protein [uncultured Psychrobacter sp.]|uniref:hypothetical protein n=1 Tax=uncultured Psychrobacter sp. TaxID=259303 RepID=UPI0030DDCD86